MKQIRNSCFETNSSSSHSLVIRTESILKELEEDEYVTKEEFIGDFDFYENSKTKTMNFKHVNAYFGRYPFRVLTSPLDKFLYVWANLCWDEHSENVLLPIIQEYFPHIKKLVAPEQLGVDEALLEGWKWQHNITERELILNNRYVIICDGDEYCFWDTLVEEGFIDFNSCEVA